VATSISIVQIAPVKDEPQQEFCVAAVKPLGEIFGHANVADCILVGGSKRRNNNRTGTGRGRRRGKGFSYANRSNKRKKRNRQDRVVRLSTAGRFTPDRQIVSLRYNDTTTARSHALSNALNWNYRSSAFDPDSAFGSGAIPGFTELANLYERYLVHRMCLRIEFGNQDTTNYMLGIWPSNVGQNVNSLVASDIIEYAANPNGKYMMIPILQAGDARTTCTAVGTRLLGRQFMSDLDFTGGTGGNPTTMFYINIGVFRADGSNMAFAITVKASIMFRVEFFGLKQLES